SDPSGHIQLSAMQREWIAAYAGQGFTEKEACQKIGMQGGGTQEKTDGGTGTPAQGVNKNAQKDSANKDPKKDAPPTPQQKQSRWSRFTTWLGDVTGYTEAEAARQQARVEYFRTAYPGMTFEEAEKQYEQNELPRIQAAAGAAAMQIPEFI